MADFSADLSQLKNIDPSGRLEAIISSLIESHNHVAAQVNASPVGVTQPPSPVAAVTVTGGGGFHAVSITDSEQSRGKKYFLEWDTNPNFPNPQAEYLGPVRQFRRNLGVTGKVFFRAVPAFQTSAPAEPTYNGTAVAPVGVDANAVSALPGIAASTGTGSEPSLLPQGASGFGFNAGRNRLPGE
jgi:hypothetical protein